MRGPLLIVVVLSSGLLVSRSTGAETPKASKGQIIIEAGKTREPLSKYIYGQFIEHLGRCIYGGIWAEMLEDRKFFQEVDTASSPWKSTDRSRPALMEKDHPFVGQHTPRLTAPGGLVQGDLALRKGRSYVGRIWLAGDAAAAPVQVSLVWGSESGQRQTVIVGGLTAAYACTALSFTAASDTDQGRLEILAQGQGKVRVGTVSLMPSDNVSGMRPDTLALLKELNAPVYRWPGGNFVSGYNWKDGIGPRDRRPPRKNPAWKGIEHNDFGLDEFLTFCRTVAAEPYIAVNSGQGDVAAAVEELQYANGSTRTAMGALRAKNGHADPYKVKFWGIGNEMYGDWQLGHMALEKYATKHNQFAAAFRAADPAVTLVAVGDVGPWSEGMMRSCANAMDLISEHFYRPSRTDLIQHYRQIPDAIRAKVAAHRRYRKDFPSLQGKDIRIAMDEWNFWSDGPQIFGELGIRYSMKDALGIAAGLNEFSRQSDMVFMANYAQTVNVIGCLKTSKTHAALETTGLVLELYRREFGSLPVAVDVAPPLDVAAAWRKDRRVLTVAIVNPTLERHEIALTVKDARLKGTGQRWQIASDDPMAYNDPDSKAPSDHRGRAAG